MYEDERDIMIKINENEKIKKYCKVLKDKFDNLLILTYEIGKCSLEELLNYKKMNKKPWSLKDIIYLIERLFEMIIIMDE